MAGAGAGGGMEFRVEDSALVYQGKMLYEAKVLKVDPRKGSYYVHYQGWKKRWDEWVSPDRIMPINEENRALAAKLQAEHKKSKAAKKKSGDDSGSSKRRKIDADAETEDDMESAVKLTMQFPLKKQLVDDWEHITQKQELVKLPREPSVATLMKDYVASRAKRAKPAEQKVVEEVATGVVNYFDRALETLLLFRFERPQLFAIKAKMESGEEPLRPMSQVYGPEHLLRLFVKLPSLLALTGLEATELSILQARLQDVLKFILKSAPTLFTSGAYEAADAEYIESFRKLK